MEGQQQRFWHVFITLPKKNESDWRQNKTLGIVAPDVQALIKMVESEFPTATIWTIQHRGTVDYSIVELKHGEFHNEHKTAWIKH